MSADKLKQIERNLAEQESFVQSIIEQREKKIRPQNNANIDNILSSSIQKAKQKISFLDSKSQPPKQDRSTDNLATSKERRQKSGEEGSAIAAAMKKLQERISNLEQENSRLLVQNKEVKKREQNQLQKNENLRRSVQENKRKIKNLQSSIQNDKNYIRELEKKNENLQKQVLQRKVENNNEQLQKKLGTSEMMYRAQEQEFKNLVSEVQTKQRKLMELENRRRQQQIRYTQQLNVLQSLAREYELKAASSEQKSKQKDMLIQSLKNEIKNMESQRLKVSTIGNNTRFEFNENELYLEKQSQENKASRRKALEMEINKDNEIEELKDKYQQLFTTYKHLDQKSRQDKLEVKNYRNKFWQLKEAVKELIDRIQTLPNGVVAQLKFLIVKVNKIQAFSNEYFAATPTKSERKNSLVNSSASRSKSNSRRKQIKLDLNGSNNSAKSKRSSHTNRSTQSRKSIKSKEKQVIVSQKTIKRSEVMELQAQIQQIRKRYKELVMAQNKSSEDVSEDLRQQLNNLAILLQQKSQQLTKMKKKK